MSASCDHPWDAACWETHVATSEITALKHEFGDHAMELGARVSKALLTSAERTEILAGLGNDTVVEVEVDAAGLFCGDISKESKDKRPSVVMWLMRMGCL
jgi:hypothetical protein